ncbi:hypothetical protein BCON_0048g00380 [Botryotinia convoluta]|uniref:Uncharacterized protein n=1 Tax=Botryotinia convoluta TaxID=54673 RepID=A0A4Z1IHU7_9HELO|nr:hypothetical protein BCON_0048g00380 [Botryotinia convoluta]
MQTGIRTGDIFSQILVTTRNPSLDEIARGHSLSSADVDVMKDDKLRLGKLKRPRGENGDYSDGDDGREAEHAAFGLAEQVDSLRRVLAQVDQSISALRKSLAAHKRPDICHNTRESEEIAHRFSVDILSILARTCF